jgi:hypothetical protein
MPYAATSRGVAPATRGRCSSVRRCSSRPRSPGSSNDSTRSSHASPIRQPWPQRRSPTCSMRGRDSATTGALVTCTAPRPPSSRSTTVAYRMTSPPCSRFLEWVPTRHARCWRSPTSTITAWSTRTRRECWRVPSQVHRWVRWPFSASRTRSSRRGLHGRTTSRCSIWGRRCARRGPHAAAPARSRPTVPGCSLEGATRTVRSPTRPAPRRAPHDHRHASTAPTGRDAGASSPRCEPVRPSSRAISTASPHGVTSCRGRARCRWARRVG